MPTYYIMKCKHLEAKLLEGFMENMEAQWGKNNLKMNLPEKGASDPLTRQRNSSADETTVSIYWTKVSSSPDSICIAQHWLVGGELSFFSQLSLLTSPLAYAFMDKRLASDCLPTHCVPLPNPWDGWKYIQCVRWVPMYSHQWLCQLISPLIINEHQLSTLMIINVLINCMYSTGQGSVHRRGRRCLSDPKHFGLSVEGQLLHVKNC